ncbi:MAG: transcription/translation regulatory transformer protein RfaH [Gammaproteobacteria bacterium]|nr:transcription/translation regulatory transformer protein RfaH [Gammaproteobacteria bacterium]
MAQKQIIENDTEKEAESLSRSSWYLVATKPRQEVRAEEHLSNQSIVSLLPMAKIKKRFRDKVIESLEPLFPGYIFVKVDSESAYLSKIRSTRGVKDFIRFGQELAKVPLELIHKLQDLESTGKSCVIEVNELPRTGDFIHISSGPFSGLDAIFCQLDGDRRAIVLLDILGKSQRLIVPLNDIDKFSNQQ